MKDIVEPFPVWKYIEEEITERGWSREELAIRMGGDADVNLLALEFLEYIPDYPGLRLGRQMAERLSRVFGTCSEFWMNLDESYHLALSAQKASEQTPPPRERG